MSIVYAEGSTLSFDGTAVGQITNVTPVAVSTAAIPKHHLGSTTKTYRPSKQPEVGTLDCEMYLNSTNFNYLATCWESSTVGDVVIISTDDADGTHQWSVEAFITDLGVSGIEEDGNISVSCSWQCTEPVDYTYTADST